MKAFYLKSLFAAALAVTLSSCEKKAENIENVSEKNTTSISKVVYPLNGNEMSTSILPKRKNLPDAVLTKDCENYPKIKVKVIDLVCEEYLKETTKLDLSYLKEGEFKTKVNNKEFSITTTEKDRNSGFRKLSNGAQGWWAHWNYSPYTESEYPSVLFAGDKSGRTYGSFDLTFNKWVTIFGFEVAPNALGETIEVSVVYQEDYFYRQPNMFYVTQTVSSPSGARLIAVKSNVPFRRAEITQKSGAYSGLAISNIRYALAK